jgi:beta-lactamase class A
MSRTILLALVLFGAAQAASLRGKELADRVRRLTQDFDGRVGVCVEDRASTVCENGDQRFSLQSVMKLIVAVAVMDRIDNRDWRLNDSVVVRKEDLSVFVQPIAALVTEQGYRTTIGDLVRRAIVDSDSAAADILIARLGGPEAVQAFLNHKSIIGVRVDRDEKHLQTEILGLDWRPEFVDPAVLDQATKNLPEETRDAAYRRYQTDERDTATPRGMSSFLFALAAGKLVSEESTVHLLKVMAETSTFPDRLKAGLAARWTLAHKTGTSGEWKGVTAATNDVGILTAPDGGHFVIAVFIGDSRETSARRAALMASIARIAVANYW